MTEKIKLPKQQGTPAVNEGIKAESNYLRGTLEQSMKNPVTGSIGV